MDEKTFESRVAAKLLDVPERTLRYWATSIPEFKPKKDAVGRPGKRRRYSYKNLVEAAILRELDQQNVTISVAGKALVRVRDKGFENQAFCYLLIMAKDRIEVINDNDLDINEYRKNIEIFGHHGEAIPNYLFKSIREADWDKYKKKHMNLIVMASLAKRILFRKKSTLIVPVHFLCDEMGEKVEVEP